MHALIHPTSGLYCLAIAQTQGLQHKFFATLQDAVDLAMRLDSIGRTVYLAQSTFKTDENRKGDNVAWVRGFWLDIDCGEAEKFTYKNKREAANALMAFVKASGMPMPLVTDSGGGLYAHWLIDQDIPPQQWRTIAQVFKQTVIAYDPGLQDDATRTADLASVLRPWGSTNRKTGRDERIVTLKNPNSPVVSTLREFVTCLGQAGKAVNLKPTLHQAPKAPSIEDEFTIYQTKDSSAELIEGKCEQVRLFIAASGKVGYEHWRGTIGLLKHCVDGWEKAVEWGANDSGQLQEKWDSWSTGPATCEFFSNTNTGGCIGCKHKDKVKSPIQLGRPEPVAMVLDENEGIEPPEGFTRTGNGVVFSSDDGRYTICSTDIFPISLAFDESLGYEVMTLRYRQPHNGWKEFPIRSALLHDTKALLTALTDNHVHVNGNKERKLMEIYLGSYAQKLQQHQKTGRLLCQMGWKELDGENVFVLGRKVFHADGSVETAALARNVPQAAEAYKAAGELKPWIEATRQFDTPGMEPLAFAFLAGAFGAPMMKFTGYDGAMVCTLGKSGLGKTLVARWIQSTYGEHAKLMMLRDDTKNSLVSRLGVYGNLPLTIDEVTNISPEELSDLVYRVTQGRDKARLNRNAVERGAVNHWNTLAVVSSNSSLAEKLAGHKLDASAELNRLFEYEVGPVNGFGRDEATSVYRTITENYGHAGELYVARIVQNYNDHQAKLDKLTAHIELKAGMAMEERYWVAVIAASIYGGAVAKAAGLIDFDVNRVLAWAISAARGMQSDKGELASDPVAVLAAFLDEHAANRLVVEKKGTLTVIHEAPRGALYVRTEIHSDRAFISRVRFRDSIMRKGGNFGSTVKSLVFLGVIVNPNRRKVLGSDTQFTGATQPCLEIDLKSPNLGMVVAALVQTQAQAVGGTP